MTEDILNLGGTLAAADTEERNNFLIQLANNMGPDGFQQGPWIGGKKIGEKWVWTKTGESLEYEDWWPGQPDHDNENCIHYWAYHQMKWNNAPCSVLAVQFICEKPAYSINSKFQCSLKTSIRNLILTHLCPIMLQNVLRLQSKVLLWLVGCVEA